MKYKQAIFGGLAAFIVGGAIQGWITSGETSIDPRSVRVGRMEIYAADHSTNDRIPISVGLGPTDNTRLFRYSIRSLDGYSYELIYATNYDPLIGLVAEGYEKKSIPLSALESQSSHSTLRRLQNKN